jgi:hypothetical protein
VTARQDPTPEVARGARADRWVVLAAVACCAALPLGLLALGASVGGLATRRWWLLGLAVVIAVAAVAVHVVSRDRDGC